MKIILFGCGTLGFEALCFLGNDNVKCFCDNNPNQVDCIKFNKEVISFNELLTIKDEYIVVICASIYMDKAYSIMQQLEENKIQKYWIYEDLKKNTYMLSYKQRFEYIQNIEMMYNAKCEFFRKKVKEKEHQLEYLKNNINVKHMKKATGRLRKRQLELIEASDVLFKDLAKLKIHPFLYAGNLIGYIRHNGFIPWDDDIDFGLIRKDYEKLRNYCFLHSDDEEIIQIGKRKYKFIDNYDVFQIILTVPVKERIWIDFFSFDYYADDYLFKDFNIFDKNIKQMVTGIENRADKVLYVREKMKKNPNIVIKSNTIYMGVDSQTGIYNIGKMMPKDILYPLRKDFYEGKEFWIPNKPEEFCSYIYEDIWKLPNDIGICKHLEDYDEK